MNHRIGQTSSNTDTHSDELQLAVLTQQKKRPQRDILPFEVKHYRHHDEINLLLNVAKQLKYHYFAADHQQLPSLPDKASQVSRTAFLSYLIEIYGAQLKKKSIFLFVILLRTHIFPLYMTPYLTHYQIHSDTLLEFLN